jgi:hypothetical protein
MDWLDLADAVELRGIFERIDPGYTEEEKQRLLEIKRKKDQVSYSVGMDDSPEKSLLRSFYGDGDKCGESGED